MAGSPALDLHAFAHADEVGRLRRAVRRWLAGVLDDPDLADDLTLAVSEALENAADHAYVGREPGTMAVTAGLEADVVVIRVRDDGSWLDSPSGAGRGRGIALMESLADSAVVTPGPEGTTVTLTQPVRTRVASGE